MKRYTVRLKQAEREQLESITRKGSHSSRKVINALVLLNCDQGELNEQRASSEEIAAILRISTRKLERVKKRFVKHGMAAALGEKPGCRPTGLPKADSEFEAQLLALLCSRPPQGHSQWSLRSLADHAVQLKYIDSVSYETVRRVLKKNHRTLAPYDALPDQQAALEETRAKIKFVGVDGCPAGWFCVGFDSSGGYQLQVFPTFSELAEYYQKARLLLVDMPIGLPEAPGGRECDYAARRKLQYKAAAVFPTPTRQTVEQVGESVANDKAKAHRAASEVELAVAGKRISRQTFAIAPKIAQLDNTLLRSGANMTAEVREVHPEICFWAFNHGQAMRHPKKRQDGRNERIAVLQRIEPRTQAIFEDACGKFPRKQVAKDDILDALAAAVTAQQGFGRLRTLPESPPMDRNGLSMEMVYWNPGTDPSAARTA